MKLHWAFIVRTNDEHNGLEQTKSTENSATLCREIKQPCRKVRVFLKSWLLTHLF